MLFSRRHFAILHELSFVLLRSDDISPILVFDGEALREPPAERCRCHAPAIARVIYFHIYHFLSIAFASHFFDTPLAEAEPPSLRS